MKCLRFLLILIATIMTPLVFVKADPLTIVADEWPPFSGQELPNKGIAVDIIATTLRRAGYEVNVQILPWARIMSGVQSFEHDIVGSLFYDSELKEFLSYGDAYFETEIKFVKQKNSEIEYSSLDDLKPYSIVVGDGFLYEDQFDRADFLNKIIVTTALQGVQMVAHGRADLTLDSAEVIKHATQKLDPSTLGHIEFLPKPLALRNLHFAVRQNLPEREKILGDFSQTLETMRSDGTIKNILKIHNLD